MNEIKLIKNGEIKTKDGREFTRLVGGFGDDKPIITTKQISELIGYDNSIVTRTINRNISHFQENVDIIDLKNNAQSYYLKILKEISYTKNAYNASKNVYILSESGFLKYIQIADINYNYSDFEYKYFGEIKGRYSMIRYENNFKNFLDGVFKDIVSFNFQENFKNTYKIDFYQPNLKLAIEYDEEHHEWHKDEDIKRQQEIENELGCNFIRVNKGQEISGINKIIKYILNNKYQEVV